jgi:hypothetical protein
MSNYQLIYQISVDDSVFDAIIQNRSEPHEKRRLQKLKGEWLKPLTDKIKIAEKQPEIQLKKISATINENIGKSEACYFNAYFECK